MVRSPSSSLLWHAIFQAMPRESRASRGPPAAPWHPPNRGSGGPVCDPRPASCPAADKPLGLGLGRPQRFRSPRGPTAPQVGPTKCPRWSSCPEGRTVCVSKNEAVQVMESMPKRTSDLVKTKPIGQPWSRPQGQATRRYTLQGNLRFTVRSMCPLISERGNLLRL